jgi:hypothetical protein
MKYVIYNKDQNKRLAGEYEYRDLLFTKSSAGRILRMLLQKEWEGDCIAIVPETYDDLENAEIQNVIFDVGEATTGSFLICGEEYIEYNTGSFYEFTADREIKRYDDLIPRITVDGPVYEKMTINYGRWLDLPLFVTDKEPQTLENTSNMFDLEGFYANPSDEETYWLFRKENVPDDGFWVADLLSEMDMMA